MSLWIKISTALGQVRGAGSTAVALGYGHRNILINIEFIALSTGSSVPHNHSSYLF